jgi:hypothetical protein
MVAEMRSQGWMVVVYNRRGHIALDGERLDVASSVQAGVSELEAELPSQHSHRLPFVLEGSECSVSSREFATARSMSSQDRWLDPEGTYEGVTLQERANSERVDPAISQRPLSNDPPFAQGTLRVWPLYSDVDDMTEVCLPRFRMC